MKLYVSLYSINKKMHQVIKHEQDGRDHHHHEDLSNIGQAFFLNLIFTIIEIIGGIFTNSMAIISDAIHDFGDSISLGLAWYFQKISKKASNSSYSYGYKRFSVIGALINAVILTIGSILILIETVPRILAPEETNSLGMIGLAVLGILVNGLAVFKLKKGKSLNEKVVRLHLLEDVLGWMAILIGSILIYFFQWYFIDSILSIGISLFVLRHVFVHLKSTMKIILQGVPENIDLQKIENLIRSKKEIVNLHDLHIWTIDGNYHILSVHLVLKEKLDFEKLIILKTGLRDELIQEDIEHSTFEFELSDENCAYKHCC